MQVNVLLMDSSTKFERVPLHSTRIRGAALELCDSISESFFQVKSVCARTSSTTMDQSDVYKSPVKRGFNYQWLFEFNDSTF